MKSLKDYSVDMTEQEYHAYPAWSYSLISRYAKEGFDCIKTIHEPMTPTPSMEFGSLFDTIITKDDFDSEYVVSDSCPPPAEKNVLDYLLTVTNEPFYDIPTSVIEQAIAACQYQKKWGYDAQYKHIEAERDYYEKRRTGKKIVSSADYEDAKQMAKALWEHPVSGKIFKKGNIDGVEYLYQTKFITKIDTGFHGDVEIKIMPDLLIVDHNNKTVQPVDLKTSAMPAYDFAENFVKYQYSIQASLYTYVLRRIMDNDIDYYGYRILPYIFTDISRSDMYPVSYRYDQDAFSQINGFHFKDYQYKDWKTLLDEILSYEESNAVVPDYINPNEINDILTILNNK